MKCLEEWIIAQPASRGVGPQLGLQLGLPNPWSIERMCTLIGARPRHGRAWGVGLLGRDSIRLIVDAGVCPRRLFGPMPAIASMFTWWPKNRFSGIDLAQSVALLVWRLGLRLPQRPFRSPICTRRRGRRGPPTECQGDQRKMRTHTSDQCRERGAPVLDRPF